MSVSTRIRASVSLAAIAMLMTACGESPTAPASQVSASPSVCDGFRNTPAVVVTQGNATPIRTEARWCEGTAPMVQVLEFASGNFPAGETSMVQALTFTQAYASDRNTTLPVGVTLVGGVRGL